MPIRVIGGSAKGRQLKLVPGDSTRPVMDRVKESLFNIIGQDIVGATILDLFAGTGSVGIEALSRGAARAVFIDIDRRAIETIHDNLKRTHLTEKALVRKSNALAVLRLPPAEAYDIIYVAPPQYKGLWLEVLQALDSQPDWLTPGTQVIVQIDPSEAQPVTLARLEAVDQRRYGSTLLWFFEAHETSSTQSEEIES
jgi:16S rRNA (guanine(966)-N(2))-methyltransferase RsmD